MQKRKNKVCLFNPTLTIRRPISDISSFTHATICTPKTNLKKLHHEHNGAQYLYFNTWNPFSSFEWPIPTFSYYKTLRKLKQFDVVHFWTHSYLSILIAIIYLSFTDTKIILTLDTIPGESFKFDSWLDIAYDVYNKTIGLLLISLSTTVTLYGDSFKPYLKRISSKKPLITPTGVHAKPNTQKVPFTVAKKSVLFVGIVGERKGIDTLITIATIMPDTTFYVAGDSAQKRVWQSRSPKNMVYLGRISYIPDLLSKVGCFCLPTRGEGLCGAIMEAMLYKCPVVASHIPGNTDLIGPGEGILIKEHNISEYKKGITQAMHNTKMAKKAYAKITRQYSWQKNKKTFMRLYE